ncbi:WXG100 family type VII secretion target [Streptomyces koyangensis]
MADRVRADLDMIRQCSRDLKKIHDEFEERGNPAEGYQEDLGSEKLRDVFDDFSGTWKKTRKKLMEDLKNLSEYTRTAAKTYDEVDSELAKALRDAMKGGK